MVAQAHGPIGRNEAVRAPTLARDVGVGPACGACHDSGEIWVLDRHAGAVRMACGCGLAGGSPAAGGWFSVVAYPCAAAGLYATIFFLL